MGCINRFPKELKKKENKNTYYQYVRSMLAFTFFKCTFFTLSNNRLVQSTRADLILSALHKRLSFDLKIRWQMTNVTLPNGQMSIYYIFFVYPSNIFTVWIYNCLMLLTYYMHTHIFKLFHLPNITTLKSANMEKSTTHILKLSSVVFV